MALESGISWATVVVCVVVLVVTETAQPKEAYVLKDELPQLSYPLLPNTVPAWALPVISILLPAAVLAAYVWTCARRPSELHHLLLALLTSVALTAAITNVVKCKVGRLRPDFNVRCADSSAATAQS